jgi:hypothetical protein
MKTEWSREHYAVIIVGRFSDWRGDECSGPNEGEDGH